MKISVCVPCYEMHGRDNEFLNALIGSVCRQTHTDWEIIVSDDSKCSTLGSLCAIRDAYQPTKIKYIRNDSVKKCSSVNVNNAIRHATGEIIKPIFQDDFINLPTCFEEIVNAVSQGHKWGATGFVHTDEYGNDRYRFMTPYYNKNMLIGVNTIGCPSNIFFTKDCNELFDENLEWLMDCEFYHRLNSKYPMHTITKTLMVTRIWGNSVSYTLSEELKQKEATYVGAKYGV